MLHSVRWVGSCMLMTAMAFAGGKSKLESSATAVVAPELPVGANASFTREVHGIQPPRSNSLVGTYTSLQGRWDWQSNGGSVREIEVDSLTGNVHVVFMNSISADSAGQSAGRRTVYARSTDDGATWNNFSNVLVPTDRSGYPTMTLLQGTSLPGRVIIGNHGGGPLASNAYAEDATPGVFAPFPPLPALNPPVDGGEPIWPWVSGPADGSVVMHSSVSAPLAGSSNNYTNRTTDFATWLDPWLSVNLIDASARAAIHSNKTGRVGIMASSVIDTTLFIESTDNGATWSSTIAYPQFRLVGSDTVVTYVGWDFVYDGNNPMMAWGSSLKSPTGGIFFRGARIEFWSAATGYVDAVPADTIQWPSTMVTQSNHLPVGWPTIAKTGNRIVIAFTGLANNDAVIDTLTGRRMGDIYMVQSTDNGFTWSPIKNITKTPQIDERYPSISRYNPDGYAYMVWQEDPIPGTNIPIGTPSTPETPMTIAKQVFYKADLANIFVANDMETLSIDEPPAGNPIKEGTSFVPKATFKNVGLASQSGVTVRFQVLNSINTVVYTDDESIGSIAPGVSAQVTFGSVPGTLTTGVYTTRAIALLGGDQDQSNDTTSSSTQIIPTVTVSAGGYSVDFESPTPDGGFTGWHTAPVGGGISDWVLGTPGKTQLSHAHSGVNAWVTKLVGNHSDDQESYVGSPVLDLTAIPGNIIIEFWHNFQLENQWDGAVLQYSVDGGLSWLRADSTLGSGPNFNTALSTGWYNEDTDSGVTANVSAPMWGESSTAYVNSDGWIRSTTILPIGGLSDVRLRWFVSFDPNITFEGWAIDDVTIQSAAAIVGVNVVAGWNMVSNPVTAPDNSVTALYPSSLFSYAFQFNPGTGYQQSNNMENGLGYWAKFGSATLNNISGAPINSFGIPVSAGWNLVGSISATVDTADISSTPAGIRASHWFGFSGAYAEATQIIPGNAYWVKAFSAGTFFMENISGPAARPVREGVSLADQFNSVTIRDAKGNAQTLYFGASNAKELISYELPPVPPSGAFDARFESESGGVLLKTHAGSNQVAEMTIAVQSPAYPLHITWNIKEGSYSIADAFGVMTAERMEKNGSITVSNGAVNKLLVRGSAQGENIPTEFALFQNYPNPFNPTTNIKFGLPVQSNIQVEIFNILGQKVRTLVNGDFVAGYHVVEWNGRNDADQQLGSGIYLMKISASGEGSRSFSEVRKLTLIK